MSASSCSTGLISFGSLWTITCVDGFLRFSSGGVAGLFPPFRAGFRWFRAARLMMESGSGAALGATLCLVF